MFLRIVDTDKYAIHYRRYRGVAAVVEPRSQILHSKHVLSHLGGFQQRAVSLAERLVEALLLDDLVQIAPGPPIEVVDGKAQFAITVGSQVGRALRRLVRLQEERLVQSGWLCSKVSQYDLLAVEYHMLAVEVAIHVRQRRQGHIHHLSVTPQVDAVFLHVESRRSRGGRIGHGLFTDVIKLVGIIVVPSTRIIRGIQCDETHIVIDRHRLLSRIHRRRLALARHQRVLRGSRLVHPDALAGHEHVLEVADGDVGHVGHVVIVAQRHRLGRLPVVVHADLRHLKRRLVRCVIARGSLLTGIYRIVFTIHTGRQRQPQKRHSHKRPPHPDLDVKTMPEISFRHIFFFVFACRFDGKDTNTFRDFQT